MNLRAKILRGGTYLAARQGLGTAINVVGVLVVSRLIGPTSYGAYAAVFGIATYLFAVAQLGINVYLIRSSDDPSSLEYDQAYTLLALLGAIALGVGFAAIPFLDRWTGIAGLGTLALTMFAVLPFQLVALVASARLERALDYRAVALSDLSGQIAYYLVAIPLAWRGLGAMAPAWGFVVQQLVVSGALHYWGKVRPRFVWHADAARRMVRYGISYSASMWIWQLRDLVNPLVVARFAGPDAVAFVSIAVRLVTALTFVKTATWRLSINALGRLREQPRRLVQALNEGMSLQVLASAPVLVAFDLCARWVLPTLFGPKWLPVGMVYPFIAIATLTNAVFSLHTAALYVTDRNGSVALFHGAHVACFATAALLLVPRFGLVGYGWAEMAALGSYWVIHDQVRRWIAAPSYTLSAVWWVGAVIALFWRQLGWWSVVGPLFAIAWPGTRAAMRGYAVQLRGLRSA